MDVILTDRRDFFFLLDRAKDHWVASCEPSEELRDSHASCCFVSFRKGGRARYVSLLLFC